MEAKAETFDKERTALVFIEFQNEWIGKNAKLRKLLVKDQEQFDNAISNAGLIIEAARDDGWKIVHAGLDLRDDPGYLIFGYPNVNKAGLSKAIPNAGTWTSESADFTPPFTPKTGEYIVKGRSGASVFQSSTLDAYLRNNDINTVILMGFATHVCVESSLRQAHDIGYNTYVVTDASAAFEDTQNTYFKHHVLHHFGSDITSQELLDRLKKLSSNQTL